MLLALGIGSLFNHSARPNVDYRPDPRACLVRFYAARAVPAGDELTIFYGGSLWFDDAAACARGAGEAGPMHEHMDDADSFLGALRLGGGADGDGLGSDGDGHASA